MKRRICLILLCGIILLEICGCDSKKEYITEKVNCSILSDIKLSYLNSYVITENNDLYEFGNYSDGTHCKKIDSDLKFTKIIDSFLMDNQKNLYSVDDGKIKKYEYPKNYEMITKDENVIKATQFYDNMTYFYYLLKNDGILYSANSNYDYSDGSTRYYLENEKEYISFENEKILDFSQESQDFVVWIKTDKAYYVRRVKDEKCYQYDDIKCEYEYLKDEELTKQYNEISYIKSCENKTKCNYVLKSGTLISYGG